MGPQGCDLVPGPLAPGSGRGRTYQPMARPDVKPRFFRSAAEFRAWLERNHDRASELYVGFYKKASGKAGITYAQAVDEALCFGWIDGVLHRIDDERHMQRFSPRTAKSYWSQVNTAKALALIKAGRMAAPGLAAFERRDSAKTKRYSFEAANAALDNELERKFKANRRAWQYFSARPPGYRRTASFWVMSAKQQATRERRLATLIECSDAGKPIPLLLTDSRKKSRGAR